MKTFEQLSAADQLTLIEAIPLITLLIAGADGKIDDDELAWAKKVTEIRTYNVPEKLNVFYKSVGEGYSDRLSYYIGHYSTNVEKRTEQISKELEAVNPVLAELEQLEAYKFYVSFTSFAKHVAKASGGVLGYFSISSEEEKLMDLPMITPIEKPADKI